MLTRQFMADAPQQAFGFLTQQLTYIEPEVYKIRYPDIQYPQLIPVDTSGGEWVKSITFMSMDQFGRAAWFNHLAKDVPIADVSREKFEQGIEMAAIGYRYTLEELGQAMRIPGMNLTADRASAARRAYEEFVEEIALRGDDEKGWTGLINNADVSQSVIATDGAETGSPAWSDKTADQVLRDVNDLLIGVYSDSLTIESADTLLLPIAAQSALATRRIPDTNLTILGFLQQNNVYTMQTGQPLTIRAVRGLETAGEGGTGRMVAYRKDPQVLKLHIPMPFRFLEPRPTGTMVYDVPGIFRLGGLEIRRPGAIRYGDGVLDTAYE